MEQRSKLLWIINIVITLVAALSIYWFQFGLYILGNSWKDNSTPIMNLAVLINLGVVIAAIISAFIYKLKVAYSLISFELILAFIMLAQF